MFKRAASRSDVARARLQALAPGWVPTPELVERELAAARAPQERNQPSGSDLASPPAAEPHAFALERSGGRGFLLLLAGALLGAVAVLLIGWPRGEAAPVEVTPISGPTGEGAPSSAMSDLPAATGEQVVVDVAGLVKQPGIATLPGGSRVIDALEAAGGALPRGDTSVLNLAQLLTDGQQILVSGRTGVQAGVAATSPGTSGATSAGLISLNSATLEQLDTLPGIGPVLAQAIIDWRTENGPFTAIEQLQEVSGIGEATFADISGLVGL